MYHFFFYSFPKYSSKVIKIVYITYWYKKENNIVQQYLAIDIP